VLDERRRIDTPAAGYRLNGTIATFEGERAVQSARAGYAEPPRQIR
jgi:hypothetical protein